MKSYKQRGIEYHENYPVLTFLTTLTSTFSIAKSIQCKIFFLFILVLWFVKTSHMTYNILRERTLEHWVLLKLIRVWPFKLPWFLFILELCEVWPDWAIFDWSWWQILLQKYVKYLATFGFFLKNFTFSAVNCCGNYFGNFEGK